MDGPQFDAHVHAFPSSSVRWGSDLDLVEAAGVRGDIRGFVLKSHHESTAARAAIANQYAAFREIDCRVEGSIVLNPWIGLVELRRALELGLRIVWWPSRAEDGADAALPLPRIHHEALDLIAAAQEAGHRKLVVATGHLDGESALCLVRDARAAGVRVVVTHPLNPDVGLGVEMAAVLADEGAEIEVDALSLKLNRERGVDVVPSVRGLLERSPRVYVCSDGGQLMNGEPFQMMRRELEELVAVGGADVVEQLVAGANAWLREDDRD